MMDLQKASHDRFARGYAERLPEFSLAQRTRFLDMANDAEMRGEYTSADQLRRLALGLPLKSRMNGHAKNGK